MSINSSDLRWDPYIFVQNHEFRKFWKKYLNVSEKNVLFILGLGFDIRAPIALSKLMSLGGSGDRDAWVLKFQTEQPIEKSNSKSASNNFNSYKQLLGQNNIKELTIEQKSISNYPQTSKNTAELFTIQSNFTKYQEIIVDISAMPRMIALTIISTLLDYLDIHESKTGECINFHVLLSESADLDREARGKPNKSPVSYVSKFSSLTDGTAYDARKIWFPILGENQESRLDNLFTAIKPDEICPVIPFPSQSARRGDKLIIDYHELLFETFLVEPRNIIYASEYNPFAVYKKIFSTIDNYNNALKRLGECQVYVSPLSSKLLSVGALLACYDYREKLSSGVNKRIFIPMVESTSYGELLQRDVESSKLCSMWLRGDWEK